MPDGFVPIFRPAGASSRAGAVPDPGTVPADYVLRADATWGPQTPSATAQQAQLVSVLVPTGEASATAAAVFSPTFGGLPYVLVSGDDTGFIWAARDVSPTGCTIEGTVAIATIAPTGATATVVAFFF
jgi:hypothetical protein